MQNDMIKRVKLRNQIFIQLDAGRIEFEIRYGTATSGISFVGAGVRRNHQIRIDIPTLRAHLTTCFDPVDNVLPK